MLSAGIRTESVWINPACWQALKPAQCLLGGIDA